MRPHQTDYQRCPNVVRVIVTRDFVSWRMFRQAYARALVLAVFLRYVIMPKYRYS